MDIQSTARLVREIREEVIGLLFNRYVFRTHQEIVRANSRLQGRPPSIFSEWCWINYGVTNAIGVRRLASSTYEDSDVNLVKLLDALIREPGRLWESFQRRYPDDAIRVRTEMLKHSAQLPPDWETSACRRLLGEDRKAVINAADETNRFASKRAAHSVPDVEVHTTFSDLDDSIEVLKRITEKYTLLALEERRLALEGLHPSEKPAIDAETAQIEKNIDLLEEMKRRKLPNGWDSIFLEPWATPEVIARPLGETPPPRSASAG